MTTNDLPPVPPAPLAPKIPATPQAPKAPAFDAQDIDGLSELLRARAQERRAQEDRALLDVFRSAARTDPNAEAEADRLAKRLGVPREQMPDDINVARTMAKEQDFVAFQSQLTDLGLRERMKDVKLVRLLHDDFGNLKTTVDTFDWWFRNYEAGEAINEAGTLLAKRALLRTTGGGSLTPAEEDRLRELESIQQFAATETGFFDEAAKVIGQMVAPALKSFGAGLATAGATALASPAAAPAGFIVGSVSTMAAQSAVTEFGHQYDTIYKQLVEDGVPEEEAHNTALVTAGAYGVGAAAAEAIGFGFLAKPFASAGRALGGRLLASAGTEGLTRATAARAAGTFVTETAGGFLGEVGTEGVQELLGALAQNIAAQSTGTSGGPTLAEALKQAGEVMLTTAKGMALISPIGPTLHYAADLRRVQEAQKAQELFTRVSEAAKTSEVAKRSPDTFAQVVATLTANTSIESVFVEPAKLNAALQATGQSREQLARDLPEVAKQLAEAERTGEDVEIPMGDFAAKVAGTELYPALRKSLRFRDGFSLERTEEWISEQVKNREETATRVAAAAAQVKDWDAQSQRVETRILDELLRVPGMDKTRAQQYATLHRQWVEAQAARESKTPEQFDQEHRLTIAGPMRRGGATTPLLEQFAGALAKTADLSSLKVAQERAARGEDAEVIRQQTGWFQGAEGAWKFEFADDEAYIKNFPTPLMSVISMPATKLEDVLHHPKLFAAYPSLRNFRVAIGGAGGEFRAAERLILLDPGLTPEQTTPAAQPEVHARVNPRPDSMLSVLLHEVQHGIQSIEGFAAGGSPEQFTPETLWKFSGPLMKQHAEWLRKTYPRDAALYDRVASIGAELLKHREAVAKKPPREASDPSLQLDDDVEYRLAQRYNDAWRNASLSPVAMDLWEIDRALAKGRPENLVSRFGTAPLTRFEAYMRLAGEVEARNTQVRAAMSEAARLNVSPATTQSRAAGDQIVLPLPPGSRLPAQSTEASRDLVALHNLSSSQLIEAARLGGMPAPSIGVTRADAPYEDFGVITLIGDPALADPSKEPVFSGDVYTAAFPTLVHSTVPTSRLKLVLAALDPYADEAEGVSTLDELREYTVRRPDPNMAFQTLAGSSVVALAYARRNNLPLEIPRKPVPLAAPWLQDAEFLQWYKANKHRDPIDTRRDDPAVEAEFEQALYAAVDRLVAAQFPEALSNPEQLARRTRQWREIADGFTWRRAEIDYRNLDRTEIDSDELSRRVRAIDPDGKIDAWTNELVNGLFDPPKVKVGRKLLPANLQTLTEAMTRGNTRAAEATMTFGSGLVKASAAKRFQSLADLRFYRGRLLTSEEFAAAKDDLNRRLEAWRNDMLMHSTATTWDGKVDTWESLDNVHRALAALVKRANPTRAQARAAYARNRFANVPDALLDKAVEFAREFRAHPARYFEAKPQRAVKLSEFRGAVIPDSATDQVREVLRANNIPFTEYSTETEDGRAVATRQFIQQLDQTSRVLFQNALPDAEHQGGPEEFYSALTRAVQNTSFAGGSPTEWKAQLAAMQAKGVIKQQEVFWTGLAEYLDAREAQLAAEIERARTLPVMLWRPDGTREKVSRARLELALRENPDVEYDEVSPPPSPKIKKEDVLDWLKNHPVTVERSPDGTTTRTVYKVVNTRTGRVVGKYDDESDATDVWSERVEELVDDEMRYPHVKIEEVVDDTAEREWADAQDDYTRAILETTDELQAYASMERAPATAAPEVVEAEVAGSARPPLLTYEQWKARVLDGLRTFEGAEKLLADGIVSPKNLANGDRAAIVGVVSRYNAGDTLDDGMLRAAYSAPNTLPESQGGDFLYQGWGYVERHTMVGRGFDAQREKLHAERTQASDLLSVAKSRYDAATKAQTKYVLVLNRNNSPEVDNFINYNTNVDARQYGESEGGELFDSYSGAEHAEQEVEEALRDYFRQEAEGEYRVEEDNADVAGDSQKFNDYVAEGAVNKYGAVGVVLKDPIDLFNADKIGHGFGTTRADVNRLAHFRWTERLDVDGNKVFFIEEVQSDWADRARDYGVVPRSDFTTARELKAKASEREVAAARERNEAADDFVLDFLVPNVPEIVLYKWLQSGGYPSGLWLEFPTILAAEVEALRVARQSPSRYVLGSPANAAYSGARNKDTVRSLRKLAINDPYGTAVTRSEDLLGIWTSVPGLNAPSDEFLAELRVRLRKQAKLTKAVKAAEEVVPDAPFIHTTDAWAGLTLKHAFAHAAKRGYSRVALITGDQAAGVYSLGKAIVAMSWSVTGVLGLQRTLKITPHNSTPFELILDSEGAVTQGRYAGYHLDSVVGKEFGSQILGEADGRIAFGSSNAQEIGSVGMRTFYGNADGAQIGTDGESVKNADGKVVPAIVPKLLRELAAQIGAKVEKVRIPEDPSGVNAMTNSFEAFSVEIPPSAREEVAKGFALFQEERGAFDPSTNTIFLNPKADPTTVLHEMSHFWLTTMFRMADMPTASASVRTDAQTVLNWFGVKDLTAWNSLSFEEQRRHHEAWAYNAEAHFFGEGKAPAADEETVRLFRAFGRFVRAVYKNVRDVLNAQYRRLFNTDLPGLTPDVRAVFDRMVASEDAIAAARAERALDPLFRERPEGMSDAEWTELQKAAQDANDAAVDEVQRAQLRAIKWLGNNEARVAKQLQRATRAARRRVEIEERAKLEQEPTYRAIAQLRYGVTDENGETRPLKLSLAEFRALSTDDPTREARFGVGASGMLSTEGIGLDLAAQMLGFATGAELVRALDVKPLDAAVQERADARMLAEHSELTDPTKLRALLEEAVHNEAAAKLVATELRWLGRAAAPVQLMVRAAKAHAREVIGKKQVGKVRPHEHALAETRNRREAERELGKGNRERAASLKRRELLEHQMEREALEVRREIAAVEELVKKLFRDDKKLAATRSVDHVAVARYLASAFGLARRDVAADTYVERLRAYNPELFERLQPQLEQARAWAAKAQAEGRQVRTWRDMTVDEFRDLYQALDALWQQAGAERKVELTDKAEDLETVAGKILDQNSKLPPGTPAPAGALTPGEEAGRGWWRLKHLATRPEHWALRKDGGAEPGAFTRYFWRPVRNAVNKYVTARNRYTKRVVGMVEKLRPSLKQGLIEFKDASGKVLHVFGRGNGGFGHAELVAALLHIGNAGNLERLLVGRGWGTFDPATDQLDTRAWDAFVREMTAKGYITREVMEFVQGVWDLNEEVKPLAQKAHRTLFGFYFDEVTAVPVVLPGVGTYRGGYMPAKLDSTALSFDRVEALKEREADFRKQFATTGRGFTKNRAAHFAEPLSLNLDLVPAHIDDVLRFSFIQPVIRDVEKVAKHPQVFAALEAQQPGVWANVLLPWLQRTASQSISKAGKSRDVDAFWRHVRSSAGMATMFANIPNALQQLTGVLVAAAKVSPKYLMRGFWRLLTEREDLFADIADLSRFMANRQKNQVFESLDQFADLTRNRSALAKAQAWMRRHGYFLQSALQNLTDSVVWAGAYEEALAKTAPDVPVEQAQSEAVQRADAAVRQTQSSFDPTDVAHYEEGTPFYRLFTMFTGYFNTLANLQADRWAATSQQAGWAKAGSTFMLYALTFAAPALLAEVITRTLRGQWEDEDEDGDVDVLTLDYLFGTQLRAAIAEVPVAGSTMLAPMVNAFDNKPYNDRMTTSPAVAVLERAFGGTATAIKTALGQRVDRSGNVVRVDGQNVRDVITAVGLLLGLPGAAVGSRLGYGYDLATGQAPEASAGGAALNLLTGTLPR